MKHLPRCSPLLGLILIMILIAPIGVEGSIRNQTDFPPFDSVLQNTPARGTGMPGWLVPDKPIPHHEPGRPSRAESYTTRVLRPNEKGLDESFQLTGLDALVEDDIDPLAGNYTLVDWDKIMFGLTAGAGWQLSTHSFITTTLNTIPGSDLTISGYHHAATAGDLNGDGQDEQIVAWLGASDKIYLSVGEMPGSLGRTTSAPAVIRYPDGNLDMVVRGYDEALWNLHYDGSSWNNWRDDAGGLLLSGPAFVSLENGLSSAFVIGTDNQVYRTSLYRSLALDGVDDYVDLPDNFPNVTDFTFTAWVYWNGGGVWQRIFDFGQNTNAYMFLTPSNGTNMRFAIKSAVALNETLLNAPFPLTQSKWVHVAVTLDGSNGVLYINGNSVDSQPITLTPQDVVGVNAWLGDSQFSADPNFNGEIDDVAVFDRALSATEIANIYQSGWDSVNGKILGLHMDENPAIDASILSDVSGQENHATLYTSDGLTNKAVSAFHSASWQAIEPQGEWLPVQAKQGPPQELPSPAVVARGSQLDLFRLGPDNTLRWQHSDDGNTWQAWEDKGGMLASGPGVVSLGPDHMQVFARGVDDALWYRTYNSGWLAWQRLELDGMDEGVTIASAPTVVSSGAGQIRIYVRGSDNIPYWIDYDGSSWGSWTKGSEELASALGAVWLTDHYQLFAQKNDGSLQESNDGMKWTNFGGLPPGPPRTQNVNTGLTGNIWPVNFRVPFQDFTFDIDSGYFSGDGRQQIVLAYHKAASGVTGSGLLGLAIWDPWDPVPRTIIDDPLGDWNCPYADVRVAKIATGNFDGQGRDEIAVVLVCGTDINPPFQIKLFSVTPSLDGSGVAYDVEQLADLPIDPVGGPSHFITIEIEAGDFDGNGADQIVIGSSWHHTGSYEDHFQAFAVFKYNSGTQQLERTTSNEVNWWTTKFYLTTYGRCWGADRCICTGIPVVDHCPYGPEFWLMQGVDLAVGNFDDDAADEFATIFSASGLLEDGVGDYGTGERFLLIYDYDGSQWKVNGSTSNDFRTWAFPDAPMEALLPGANLDRLVAGDLDRDTVDELAYFDGSKSFFNILHILKVFKVNLYTGTELFNPPAAAVELIGNLDPPYIEMVVGNFTNESLRVGPPTYRLQNRVDSLVAVINVPPKHRDYIKVDDVSDEYQLFEVLTEPCTPTSSDPNCTHAKHAISFSETSETETKIQRDWAVGGGLESKVTTGGAFIDNSLQYSYGNNFTKSEGVIENTTFTENASAYTHDKIVYFGTPYHVWEYPLFITGTDEPADYLTVIFPVPEYNGSEQKTPAADTTTGDYPGEPWYRAGHQTYNAWSYDALGVVRFPDFDPDQVILASNNSGGVGFAFSESTTSVLSATSSKSHDFSTEVGGGWSGGFSLFGFGFKASMRAYVNGSYKSDDIETETQTTSENSDISGYIADMPGAQFTTRIYGYRAKDGYLVLDYQTSMPTAGPWQDYYDSPDPAFILPWYGFPYGSNPVMPTTGLELFSPEVQAVPQSVSVGETVTITATVRNFSNVQVSNVKVRFCQGDPGTTCVPPDGEGYIDEVNIPVLNRVVGPVTVSTQWTAAGMGKQKIFAVIDPENTIDPEVHDEDDLINNNEAFTFITVGAGAVVDQGLASGHPYQGLSYNQGNSLLVSAYIPPGNLSEIIYFELRDAGITVPYAVGKPFELVAYEGDQFRDNPNYEYSLKPASSDPPAVITLDMTGRDVNYLTLYRSTDDQGTSWVEAACTGYRVHRFPEDSIIAVPICQTGIFAFLGEEKIYLPLVVR